MAYFRAWKLVRKNFDRLGTFLSAMVPRVVLSRQEYIPNVWAKARVGGLLVFGTRDDATAYLGTLSYTDDLVLWKCLCREPVILPRKPVSVAMLSNIVGLTAIWVGGEQLEGLTEKWPAGTLAFKEVKITQKEIVQ